jgi:membrane associated rhomboid family serine protease
MPSCLKCGDALTINDEGVAPVLCDRCAGVATGRARRAMAMGGMGRYPVTILLLAVNILAYLADMVPGVNLRDWGANIGPLTLSGQYWRLFTAGFLHADIFHIGFNMWCLWSLGQLSERLFGKWQTFGIYMVTGVGGALLSIANNPQHGELGASGAIFGLVGAVMAGVKFGDLNISAGEKKAIFSSVVTFSIINFALGMSGNIDNICHLGGFVTGLLLGLPLGAFARNNKILQLATLAITSAVIAAGGRELVQTHQAAAEQTAVSWSLQRGDYRSAAAFQERYANDHPEDEQALLSLGGFYAASDERDKAISAFERALKINPGSQDAKEALEELKAPTAPNQK